MCSPAPFPSPSPELIIWFCCERAVNWHNSHVFDDITWVCLIALSWSYNMCSLLLMFPVGFILYNMIPCAYLHMSQAFAILIKHVKIQD